MQYLTRLPGIEQIPKTGGIYSSPLLICKLLLLRDLTTTWVVWISSSGFLVHR